MLVCGIELKGKEAILCLLKHDKGVFVIPDCRQKLFTVSNSGTTEGIREFSFAVAKLVEDYKIEQIAIVARDQKGKFMGSATSFKLEAVLQLLDVPVAMVTNAQMKQQISRNPIQVDFDSLGLKTFQKPAFNVAYSHHNFLMYGDQATE